MTTPESPRRTNLTPEMPDHGNMAELANDRASELESTASAMSTRDQQGRMRKSASEWRSIAAELTSLRAENAKLRSLLNASNADREELRNENAELVRTNSEFHVTDGYQQSEIENLTADRDALRELVREGITVARQCAHYAKDELDDNGGDPDASYIEYGAMQMVARSLEWVARASTILPDGKDESP